MPEQAQQQPDDIVHSVPLDLDDGPDRPVSQENVGAENMEGSGEWPDLASPPRGPAPGTTAEGAVEADRRAERPGDPYPEGTATQAQRQQDGRSAGDRGPARITDTDAGNAADVDPPEGFKEVLERDPVTGGSSSIGDDA